MSLTSFLRFIPAESVIFLQIYELFDGASLFEFVACLTLGWQMSGCEDHKLSKYYFIFGVFLGSESVIFLLTSELSDGDSLFGLKTCVPFVSTSFSAGIINYVSLISFSLVIFSELFIYLRL